MPSSATATIERTGLAALHAVYYRAADGVEPVREFVEALDPRRRAVVLHQLDRLNGLSDEEPHLAFPHSSQVDGELRELRCHVGREHYRILYRRSGQLLLHAFRKSVAKVPAGGVAIAAGRFEDFRARMDAEPRRPPRPAGHDAP
jgi:phage-related protein